MTTGGNVYGGIYTRALEARYPVVSINTIESATTANRPAIVVQYGTVTDKYVSGLTRSIDGSGWYLFKDYDVVAAPYDKTTGAQFNPASLTKESLTVGGFTTVGSATVSESLTVSGTNVTFSGTGGTFQVNKASSFANNVILTSSTALMQLTTTTAAATSFGTIANSSIYTTGGLGVVGSTYMTGSLNVSANIIGTGTLAITGATTLSSTLTTTGAATFNGSLTANESVIIGNKTVAGAIGTTSPFVNLTAMNLTLSGATSENFFLTVQSPGISGTASTTNSGTLWINAPTLTTTTSSRNSAIYAATGDITLAANNSRLSILSALAPSNSTDTANASINSTGGMIVVGAAYLNAALTVGTSISSGGAISSGGNLSVAGTTTLTGTITSNSTASSTTNPPDNTTSVAVYTQGGAHIARKLYVGQESFFNAHLYADKAVTLAYGSATPLTVDASGNLTVTGSSTVDTLTAGDILTANGDSVFNGAITLNSGASITTTSMTNNFNFAGSSGSFTTSTGANVLSGNTTLASNRSLTFAVGSGGIVTTAASTGTFDFSNSSGAFTTSTGTNTLSGDTTLATGKTLTFATGATGITTAASGTGAFDFSNSSGIFKTTTGAVTIGGTGVITLGSATGYSLTTVATTGNFNLSNMTGTFATPTGAVTLSSAGNATTVAGSLTVVQASTFTGASTFSSTTQFNGAITVANSQNFIFGSGGNAADFTVNGVFNANTGSFSEQVYTNKNLTIGNSGTGDLTLSNSIGSVFRVSSGYNFTLGVPLTTVAMSAFRISSISSGTSTATNASTVYIEGAPTASGGATITNSYALFVAAGNSFFGGNHNILGNLLVVGSTVLGAIIGSSATISGTTTCQGAFISQTSSMFSFSGASGTGATSSPFFNIAAMFYSLTSGTSPVNFVTIQAPSVLTNTASEASTFVIAGPPSGATLAWAQKITTGGLFLAGANTGAVIRNSGTAAASISAFDTTASISTAGGASIQTNLFVGTTAHIGTGLTILTGGITVTAGTTSLQATTAAGDVTITSATDSSDSAGTIGSLATLGGLSVAKKIYGGTGLTISAGGAAITGNSSITGTLLASGATTLQSTLGVTGATTLSSSLTTTGATALNGGLGVSYTGGISGSGMTTSSLFNVAGTTYTSGSGSASIYFATLPVSTVSGSAALAATLWIGGEPTGAGVTAKYALMTASGASLFDSTDARVIIAGTTDSTGAADIAASFSTAGGASIAKKLFVGTNFAVAGTSALGASTFSGNVAVSGSNTLTVGGATTLSGAVTITGVTTHNNTLYVSNGNNVNLLTQPIDTGASISTAGGLSVAKAASVNGILQTSTQFACTAVTDSSGYTDTAASIYTAGGATITKALNVGTNLNVQQNAAINGNLTVSGTLSTVNSATLTITNHIAIVNTGDEPGTLLQDSAFMMARNGTSIVANATDDADKVSTTLASNYTGESTSIVITANTGLDFYKGWVISDGTNTASIAASPAAITGAVTLTLDAALRPTNLTSGSTIQLYKRRLVGLAWDESDNQLAAYAFPRDVSSFDPLAVDGSAPVFANLGVQDLRAYGDITVDGSINITGTLDVNPNPVATTLISNASYTITATDARSVQTFFVNTAGTITLPLWSALSPSAVVSSAYAGKSYIIRVVNLSTGVVTVETSGSDTIDGELTSYDLEAKYRKITLMSADSGAWIVL